MISFTKKSLIVTSLIILALAAGGLGIYYYHFQQGQNVTGGAENTNPGQQPDSVSGKMLPQIQANPQTLETSPKNPKGGLTICADKCGDSICQNTTNNTKCENGSLNCICTETRADCPQDCK